MTNITNARWEISLRGTGVVFDAESADGSAEFIVVPDTLADLAGDRNLNAQQCLEVFADHAAEISEAAGADLKSGVAARGRLTHISADKLPSLK